MKKFLIGVCAVILIVLSLFMCMKKYVDDHFKVGAILSGGFIVREIKDVNSFDECVAQARKVVDETPDVSKKTEIPRDDRFVVAFWTANGGGKAQICILYPGKNNAKYILAIKPDGGGGDLNNLNFME